jgi:hypothetical protein
MTKKKKPTSGFISLHRSINENTVVCKNPTAFYIWVKCLLRANFKNTTFYLGKKKISLKKGQFLISYPKFSDEIGVSQTTLYDWILIFEKERMIERKSYSKYTVISILNYSYYQQVRKVFRKMAGKQTGKQKESKKKQYNNDNKDNILPKGNTKAVALVAGDGLKQNKSNKHVSLILEEFERLYGFPPTDKYPRRPAWNIVRKFNSFLKKTGRPQTDVKISEGIKKYFTWVGMEDWSDKVQTLDVLRRKLDIFFSKIKESNDN